MRFPYALTQCAQKDIFCYDFTAVFGFWIGLGFIPRVLIRELLDRGQVNSVQH